MKSAAFALRGTGRAASELEPPWDATGTPHKGAGWDFARSYLPEMRKAAHLARPALLGVALLLACATALLILPGSSGASAPEEPKSAATRGSSSAPEKPAWQRVIRPIRLLALESPELVKAAPDYDAVRSTKGDGREDILSFGSVARNDALFMRLAVYRAGSEAADPAPFFVDLARRAVSAGLAISKATPGEPMRTKFGDMETADVRLSMNGVERSCLAFRRAVSGEGLRLAGWYCAPAGGFAGRAGLSCLVDRLALISAGEDHVLRDGFVAAERRRPACGKAPLLAASAGGAPLAQNTNPPRLRGIKTR
ncbi:MAG: hypothetical protein ACHQAY_01615 [Hyphomicrobiales bacterium]